MKVFLFLNIFIFSHLAIADSVDDIFNPGINQFSYEKLADNNILLAIDKDAKIACQPNGQCVLSSTESNSNAWEIAFNVGQGGGYMNSGTTIITGGYDSGYGTCPTNDCLPTHWGLTLTKRNVRCSQKILVPRSLYYSMNRYLYGLLQENGEPKKGFTPADETMIIFYSTIMKQASNSSCGGR